MIIISPDGHSVPIEPSSIGGKAHGISVLESLGLNVPPSITVPIKLWKDYSEHAVVAAIDYLSTHGIIDLVMEALDSLNALDPTTKVYSVRSGAPISMPGMMDTVLNVGLTEEATFEKIMKLNPEFAWDSLRRFLVQYATTACGVDQSAFDSIKNLTSFEAVTAISSMDMSSWGKHGYSDTLRSQILQSMAAVWESWFSERAIMYRKANGIPHDLGTAIVIQKMVFGNFNDISGSGVLFTRNPSTGAKGLYGEIALKGQGEDVVSGTVTPVSLESLKKKNKIWKKIYAELEKTAGSVEAHFRDMQDMEFTVEDGTLYWLQTRKGKRSASAAFKIARDMHMEGLIPRPSAILSLRDMLAANEKQLAHKPKKAIASGIGCGCGAATGEIWFSSEESVENPGGLLVMKETTPDDIAGIMAASGVLTFTGGKTSHAAVVARGMNIPCVVGVSDLAFCHKNGSVTLELCKATQKVAYAEGVKFTIDGNTGKVYDKGLVLESVDQCDLLYCALNSAPETLNIKVSKANIQKLWEGAYILAAISKEGKPVRLTVEVHTFGGGVLGLVTAIKEVSMNFSWYTILTEIVFDLSSMGGSYMLHVPPLKEDADKLLESAKATLGTNVEFRYEKTGDCSAVYPEQLLWSMLV